jgi:tRNA pseudouridine38-40 synthase
MPRYKATIEYLGTNYAGWQIQPNAKTIQEEIERALFKFCGQYLKISCAGRTDAGVHAIGQVAHFDLAKEYSEFEVFRAVNFYLKGSSITFIDVKIVDQSFDARFSATQRHYLYKIINRPAPLAIEEATALLVKKDLDLDAMRAASQFLVGQHDFSSFRSSECGSKNPVKILSQIDIISNKPYVNIYFSANAFLHHMVRNIVGTLILVGKAKITPYDVKKILAAKARAKAGPTSPAHGLYLLQIDYFQ